MILQQVDAFVAQHVSAFFTIGNATASLPGMFVAFCIAVAFTLGRVRRHRDISWNVLRRALLPGRIIKSPSGRTDLAFTFCGVFILGFLLGGAILSAATVGSAVQHGLVRIFGTPEPSTWPPAAIVALTTLAGYLAYELGYWLHHYLCHRIKFLWEFHAVHHSAESLSPLTNFRVHPVDTLLFGNVLAVLGGAVLGLLSYLFSGSAHVYLVSGTNVLVLAGLLLLTNLQHSHLWISFPGFWGKVFLSPAHHQIHHSRDPAHFNQNLGSTLAIWDALFGTLYLPKSSRERLEFGVDGFDNPHSFHGAINMPFIRSANALWNKLRRDDKPYPHARRSAG
jgi:sterol desaturase/sphingolipid hydroxylase (fatty acid hydroxylase superfamily)